MYDMLGLIPCSKFLLEKPIVAQLVKKLPDLYGARRFLVVFTRARHWFLSPAK
jgi:hypothetical protein